MCSGGLGIIRFVVLLVMFETTPDVRQAGWTYWWPRTWARRFVGQCSCSRVPARETGLRAVRRQRVAFATSVLLPVVASARSGASCHDFWLPEAQRPHQHVSAVMSGVMIKMVLGCCAPYS